MFYNRIEGTYISDYRQNMMCIMLEGATYFGERNSVGIEYALGAGIGLGLESGNQAVSYETKPIGLAFKLGMGSKFDFNPNSGMAFGFGINGTYDTTEGYLDGYYVNMGELDLNYYGKIAFFLKPSNSIMFSLGIIASNHLAAFVFAEVEGIKDSASVDASWFVLSPYIGLSYAY